MTATQKDMLARSLDLARQILALSEEGMAASRDDGCMLVYGVIRDCAYKIQNAASAEIRAHEQEVREPGFDIAPGGLESTPEGG